MSPKAKTIVEHTQNRIKEKKGKDPCVRAFIYLFLLLHVVVCVSFIYCVVALSVFDVVRAILLFLQLNILIINKKTSSLFLLSIN